MAIRSSRRLAPVGAFTILAACGQAEESAAPRPVIEQELQVAALSPASGHISGGTRVTISGRSLDRVARVTFGEAAGFDIRVMNDRMLLVTAPPHAAGHVPIVIRDGAGRVSRQSVYYEYMLDVDSSACEGCWDYRASPVRASAPPPSRSRSAASP